MNANERDQGKPTGVLRRHAKAIIVIIVAVAFLLPTALVLVGSVQGPSDGGGDYSDTGTGSDAPITDFTKLTRDERRRIIEGSPGANLTDAQKKEFIDTGMITSGGESSQDGTQTPKGTTEPGTPGR